MLVADLLKRRHRGLQNLRCLAFVFTIAAANGLAARKTFSA
jgi:hypothetical protein